MSYRFETLARLTSHSSTQKEWTAEEEATFAEFIEGLKHLRDEDRGESLIVNARRAILQRLRNFGARRMPMIPFVERSNPINRILGRWRHRLLGPKRIA